MRWDGSAAAFAAADLVVDAGAPPRVLVTGLCGGLSPALDVGDVVAYSVVSDAAGAIARPDDKLTTHVLDRIPGAQSGVRALSSAVVVIDAAERPPWRGATMSMRSTWRVWRCCGA